jgi:hypothetical protein
MAFFSFTFFLNLVIISKGMKCKMKILAIPAIMAGLLAAGSGYAAKVCVSGTIADTLDAVRGYYCSGSGTSMIGNGTSGNYCWCFANGVWSYNSYITSEGSSSGCGPVCPGRCRA